MKDNLIVEVLCVTALFAAAACIIALSSRLESAKPDLARLAEYDALLAECVADIPADAYCELIARQRRER